MLVNIISPQSQLSLNKVKEVNNGEMTIEPTTHALALIPYALNYKVNSVKAFLTN